MHVAKALLKQVFGDKSRLEHNSAERLSRFEQVHVPDTRHEAARTDALDAAQANPENAAKQHVQPQDSVNQYRRFEPQHHRARVTPQYDACHAPQHDAYQSPVLAFENPKERARISPSQLSNAGVQDIPISVLHKARPGRFGTRPAPHSESFDEFIFAQA